LRTLQYKYLRLKSLQLNTYKLNICALSAYK